MPTQQLKLTYMGSPLYKGVDASVPETDVDNASTPFVNNVVIRRGEIRSRYRHQAKFRAPNDGTATRGIISFFDINAIMHTVAITRLGIYQLSINWPAIVANNGNPWLILANFNTEQPDAQYAMTLLQTNLFFTNGGDHIYKWNGLTNTVQTLDGLNDGTTFSAFHLMELGAKIICAYTIETKAGTTNVFPYRIRWTNTPPSTSNAFDPSVNLGAGFNDELDVPDAITGLLPLGRTGYIYRNNGITEMIPNSSGSGFDFDHLWASDRGIGNVLPQSIAGYGPMHFFVAGDNIYQLTPNSFNAVGGAAYNAIAQDIENAFGMVFATVVPYFSRSVPYTVYWITIPQENDTVVHWLYDINEHNWTRWSNTTKGFTCKPRSIYIS